jgi:hypothetical protein
MRTHGGENNFRVVSKDNILELTVKDVMPSIESIDTISSSEDGISGAEISGDGKPPE